MDSKNVIAAIALSSAVIVLYSLFFVPEKPVTNQNLAEKNKIEQNADTPNIEEKNTLVHYKVSNYYSQKHEVTLKWNDKNLSINCPILNNKAILSDKDNSGIDFMNLLSPF